MEVKNINDEQNVLQMSCSFGSVDARAKTSNNYKNKKETKTLMNAITTITTKQTTKTTTTTSMPNVLRMVSTIT